MTNINSFDFRKRRRTDYCYDAVVGWRSAMGEHWSEHPNTGADARVNARADNGTDENDEG